MNQVSHIDYICSNTWKKKSVIYVVMHESCIAYRLYVIRETYEIFCIYFSQIFKGEWMQRTQTSVSSLLLYSAILYSCILLYFTTVFYFTPVFYFTTVFYFTLLPFQGEWMPRTQTSSPTLLRTT